MVKELDRDSFKKEVLNSADVWLVDFWAEWCGPCKRVAPLVEEVARKYEGKIKVGKVNIDDYPQVAADFGVMSIPTLVLFKQGQEQDRIVGLTPLEELARCIDNHI